MTLSPVQNKGARQTRGAALPIRSTDAIYKPCNVWNDAVKRRLLVLASTIWATGCSVVGDRSGTEEPKYATIARHGPLEIRQYAPRLAAETTASGTEEEARTAGFKVLAAFIFGANKSKREITMTAPVTQATAERIAMTAPVVAQTAGSDQWIIRFYMPSGYTTETLPVPNDPSIHIVTIPSETLAVLRFPGSRSADAMAEKRAELQAALHTSGWESIRDPLDMFYDPPWTLPALRRNEVAVPVRKTPL